MKTCFRWAAAVLMGVVFLERVCADSIDDAEAKRRGVPVQQVELEKARARNAVLEKEVADLQEKVRQLEGGGGKGGVPATAVAGTQPKGFPAASGRKEISLDVGDRQVIKLVQIPPGKFVMGSAKTETGHFRDEEQHEVTISKAFYMGMTHVTVDQFAVFVKDSGYKTDDEKSDEVDDLELINGTPATVHAKNRSWNHLAFEQKGDHPVVCVSVNDATAFCKWLAKKSGKGVGLPTEAQWEYAARGGTRTPYIWGNSPEGGKGWANVGDENFEKAIFRNGTTFYWGELFPFNDGFLYTSPVASFKANAFGLYDMTGNATQWCLDGWKDYDTGAVMDPLVKNMTNQCVDRGGSWGDDVQHGRVAARSWGFAEKADSRNGFRVVVME